MPDVEICEMSNIAYTDVVKNLIKFYGVSTTEGKDKLEFQWEFISTIIEAKPPKKIGNNFCPYTISYFDNRKF